MAIQRIIGLIITFICVIVYILLANDNSNINETSSYILNKGLIEEAKSRLLLFFALTTVAMMFAIYLVVTGSKSLISADQDNKMSLSLEETSFSGEKNLKNDAYKIFLVKTYDIERIESLDKFSCKGKLFDSVDEALVYADSEGMYKDGTTEAAAVKSVVKLCPTPEDIEKNDNDRRFIRNLKYGVFTFLAITALYLASSSVMDSRAKKKEAERRIQISQENTPLYNPECFKGWGYAAYVLVEKSGTLASTNQAAQAIRASEAFGSLPPKSRCIDKFQAWDNKWRLMVGGFDSMGQAELFKRNLSGYGVDIYASLTSDDD
jgi:hypothetical protein